MKEKNVPITHLDLFEIKPDFRSPALESHRRYVLPGVPSPHIDPAQWVFVGRFHTDPTRAAWVNRHGHFDVRAKAGREVSARAAARYAV